MAVGDAKGTIVVLAPGAYIDIKPPPGEEWVVHNLYWSGGCTILFTDGVSSVVVDAPGGAGCWLEVRFHVSSGFWLRVVNGGGGSVVVGFDGVQTK